MLTFIRRFWQLILLIIFVLVAIVFAVLYFGGDKNKTNTDADLVKKERASRKAQILYSADSIKQAEARYADSVRQDSIRKVQMMNCPDQVVKGNYSAPNGYDVTLTMRAPQYMRQRTTRQANTNYRPRSGPGSGYSQTQTRTSDVPEKSFGDTFKSTTSAPTVTKSRSSSEVIIPGGGDLAITVYEGGIEGTRFTSFDKDGYLVYGVKDEGVQAANPSILPELNRVGGPQFTLDPNQGWWFYTDKNRLVSVQEINDDKYAIDWGVFIGMVNTGGYRYENWLPHAWTKGTLMAVRGKEWGEITDSDLAKMHQLDPNIWTESTGGTIKFFRPNDVGGRVLSPDDHNLYYGAKFHTRIYGKRKVTRTIN